MCGLVWKWLLRVCKIPVFPLYSGTSTVIRSSNFVWSPRNRSYWPFIRGSIMLKNILHFLYFYSPDLFSNFLEITFTFCVCADWLHVIVLFVKFVTFYIRDFLNCMIHIWFLPCFRHSMSCATRLGRGITLIMMHSTLLNMGHRKAKGYTLIKHTYLHSTIFSFLPLEMLDLFRTYLYSKILAINL